MWGRATCRRRPAAAALLALVACATLAGAALPANVGERRELLVEEVPQSEQQAASTAAATAAATSASLPAVEPWGNFTVLNGCPFPVRVKASYAWMAGVDEGQACQNPVPTGDPEFTSCSTDWQGVVPEGSVTLQGLPENLWMYSAVVEGSSPPFYPSRQHPEARLATAGDSGVECEDEVADVCVWWSSPNLEDSSTQLTLRCPGYQPGVLPPAAELASVEVENRCSQAVQFKVSYQLPEGDVGEDCASKDYFGEWDHRCVTEWRTLEPGESRLIAQTSDPYWKWGAVVADAASGAVLQNLARLAQGAFQAGNDTVSCLAQDPDSPDYNCEWWAPNCHMCESFNMTEPLVLTCDEELSVPLPTTA